MNWLRAGRSVFDPRRGLLRVFLFYTASTPALGPTRSPIQFQWVAGALSPGVKRPYREANHSPFSSSEVKNAWSYTSTPQYIFMKWYLVKNRHNFTFTFTGLWRSWVKQRNNFTFMPSSAFLLCWRIETVLVGRRSLYGRCLESLGWHLECAVSFELCSRKNEEMCPLGFDVTRPLHIPDNFIFKLVSMYKDKC
jgi:hypothetical protein